MATKEYTPEQQMAFRLISNADKILFMMEDAMRKRGNPTNHPIVFEITQGQYDIQKFRRLLQRWRDLIELLSEEIPDQEN